MYRVANKQNWIKSIIIVYIYNEIEAYWTKYFILRTTIIQSQKMEQM